jgi:RNA polymerase sigma-70 factor (ECF subfamily)
LRQFAEQSLKADPAGEEERLLIEAAQRDPGGFAELYERNFARVYAYVARHESSRAEAEDVTAEVFQQALANLARFEWRGVPFAAWLRRMAANAIADRWHAAQRETGEPDRAPPDPAGAEDIERSALLFCIAEMAQDLGRSAGAIKQLQWRALRSLRELAGRAHA